MTASGALRSLKISNNTRGNLSKITCNTSILTKSERCCIESFLISSIDADVDYDQLMMDYPSKTLI